MKSSPTHNLRRFVRIPFHADVQLVLQSATFTVQLLDIALKGALVQCAQVQRLRLHDSCRLLLPMAGNGEGIEMACQIAHLEGDHVGLACTGLDVSSLTRLRRLIELNSGDAELMHRELRQLFGPG